MISSIPRTLTLGMDGHETEIAVDVLYSYTPGGKGARERGTGLALEPDYGPEVELTHVMIKTSKGLTDILPLLSGEHVAEIESAIAEELVQ